MNSHTKIWVGVGAYLLVGAHPASAADVARADTAAPAQPGAAHSLPAATSPARLGGEGGEGGEGGGGPVRDSADYVTRLLLMKGHLRVGQELFLNGDTGHAAAHFMHPRAELYDSVAPALRQRGAQQFLDELDALAQASLAKKQWAEVQPVYDRVLARIDEAVGRVDDAEGLSPNFVITVVVALLQNAAEEYRESVSNGAFVNIAEYQDSRGFFLSAGDLLRKRDQVLRGRSAAAYDLIMRQYARLAKAWPAVVPPAQPLLAPQEVQAAVSRIELEATQLK